MLDLLHAMQPLSQLSYSPTKSRRIRLASDGVKHTPVLLQTMRDVTQLIHRGPIVSAALQEPFCRLKIGLFSTIA